MAFGMGAEIHLVGRGETRPATKPFPSWRLPERSPDWANQIQITGRSLREGRARPGLGAKAGRELFTARGAEIGDEAASTRR